MSTIASQPGYQRLLWGRQTGSPSTVKILVDWDSLDAHKAFIASDVYKPFMDDFGSILTGPALLYHAHFEPHPPKEATDAPVTQCLTMYLPTSAPSSQVEFFERHIHSYHKMAQLHGKGYHGGYGGWIEEELEYKGKKKRAYTVVMGWESLESAEIYKQTGAFEGAIGGMRDHSDGLEVGFFEFQEMI